MLQKMKPVVSRLDSAMLHLSTALTVVMHLACLFVFVVPFSMKLFGLFAFGYVLRMFAITGGYHRYFSHRSYKTSRAFQFALAFVGTSAMQNGPLWWASWHRHHHKHSDTPRDAHSPVQGGFWHAHIGWFLSGSGDHPDFSNVKDLSVFPELRFLEKHKWMPIVAYGVACFAIAGTPGLVWGFLLSTIAVLHATALINSLAHVWGSRRFDTSDDSRNNALLAVITMGEGWHNNHHNQMGVARQGVRWWELDVTYYALRFLALLGIVWDIRERRPPRVKLLPILPVPLPVAAAAE
ncbi:MAG: Stearoyl-CoA 9-desaturase [Myxococcaceae bacterium]|jgi:stearoyl-CoA desaturase (delta-9 desaturase)|nr:Stearoyl-CoA 9-desaturase [Myxococcaceae bacterium]